jgi:dolichol-phosphate mannosyltransferase
MRKIPLSRVFLNEEVREAALRALESGSYILAKECEAFEQELADYIGTKHAVLCSSWTAGGLLLHRAMGLKAGDEILVPSHTAFPTIEPMIHFGAKPVFIDIDETYCLDVDLLDCSTDKSWNVLKQLVANDQRLRVQRFKFNCGESAASWAGMHVSRGRYIATLDADLQNDPRDLPAMLEALKNADCACGTRAATRGRGDNWIRIVSSRIANWVRNKLSGENISDAGCTYRVFKRECIRHVKFFNGGHRFLPTSIKMEGFRVVEVPVSTNPRFSGTSHYGVWNRLFKSFRDLLAVRRMKSRQIRYEIAEMCN